jgi:hypothetical protein
MHRLGHQGHLLWQPDLLQYIREVLIVPAFIRFPFLAEYADHFLFGFGCAQRLTSSTSYSSALGLGQNVTYRIVDICININLCILIIRAATLGG